MTDDLFPPTLPIMETMARTGDGRSWLAALPALVDELRRRWSLELGAPFHGGTCSWVAPARLPDGGAAVFKVSWPHREAAGEAEALRRWDGRGAVQVYRHDRDRYALLLELCEPGGPLRAAGHIAAEERLLIGAEVLGELWSASPPAETGLERLDAVTAEWADLAGERMDRLRPGFDPGLVAHGVRLLRELPGTAARQVVLHGDFNPGNVLAARRRPWLAIDAKPMVGDPAYDPWPLVEQIDDPFRHPVPRPVLAARCALVAGALGEDARRLQAWAVARGVEMALWMAEHDVPGAGLAMARVRVFAGLAGL
ncbi:hydroxyurea phosphotransferase [Sphaerisporangium melleum]|uniref:Hydroxyurea phosphotransferase n=1 Tax=Sphaerisporangium melleum TaxID=321316 RepID=A0A917RLM5_9ACTN|nr:aminoglycoside phosphotransferase family protein [Sphaerisporangium melleum]GGL12697.1 hydroxyurea phosphotransferase [Sphaerisporangium melleum]GII74433.1 hydroxyurea phosphotransferase [Sphaerisporangium melleum]